MLDLGQREQAMYRRPLAGPAVNANLASMSLDQVTNNGQAKAGTGNGGVITSYSIHYTKLYDINALYTKISMKQRGEKSQRVKSAHCLPYRPARRKFVPECSSPTPIPVIGDERYCLLSRDFVFNA